MDSLANTNVFLHQLAEAFAVVPFNQMLGLKLDHLSEAQVQMSLEKKQGLIGNFLHGILHGGVISSVLDMAGGMAVMAAAAHKHPTLTSDELMHIISKCSTVDLHINFINPGHGEAFTAKSWLVKNGANIAFARMELHNPKHIIASATGTYLIK
jgi:uncharacterized protein (TIGR00369 family)